MYKVLIADDEDIICRGLAGMVSRRPQLEVAALAEDGEIALEKAREVRPDLMLVDINMPFLNGLEFIQQIQKALQLGVADYVLKPVMEQSFFEVLDKAVERLDAMAHSRKYISWMEDWVEQNRWKIAEDLLNSLLRGQTDEAEFGKHMGYLKICFPLPYAMTLIHIYREHERENFQEEGYGDGRWYLDCRKVILDCFAACSEVICFQTEEGAVAVISRQLSQPQWKELEQQLETAAARELNARTELVRQQGEQISQLPQVFRDGMEIYKERTHYSDMVLKTIAIIRNQWEDCELSLQSVADSLYVSAPHLSRMFHRETGENFGTYLTRKRMNEAKLLLKNTNLKMYEIAEKTGYTSQHYFSNAFKKAAGISPADYRKNLLK